MTNSQGNRANVNSNFAIAPNSGRHEAAPNVKAQRDVNVKSSANPKARMQRVRSAANSANTLNVSQDQSQKQSSQRMNNLTNPVLARKNSQEKNARKQYRSTQAAMIQESRIGKGVN